MLRHSLRIKLIVACLILVTSCSYADATPATATIPATEGESAAAVQSSTVLVQRGQVVKALEFDGYVVPTEETPLYFRASGYVKQVYVKQGDSVQAGDLLAELETGDLVHQIAQAELGLRSAQERVAAAAASLRQDVARAELSLQLAQEQLARAEALEVTYTAAVSRTAVAVQEGWDGVNAAEAQYRAAQGRSDEPPESLSVLLRQLRLARWDVQAAEAEHVEAVAREAAYQHDLRIEEIVVAQAQAELERLTQGAVSLSALEGKEAQQAYEGLVERLSPELVSPIGQIRLTLEQLRAQLARARVVSPVDGQVLSLPIRPGHAVEPFQAVIAVADRSEIEVSAELSAGQMIELTEGQPASVSQSGASQRVWKGAVRCLPYPYGTCASEGNPAGAVDSARISLQDSVDNLRMGEPVHVSIILEEKDDVLWLPPTAIRAVQGREFVIVQEGRRERRVEVMVGIAGADRTEILSGLEEGQTVIVP